MDPYIIMIIAAIAALVVGIIVGKLIFAKDTRKRVEEAELQAQTLIKEAELRAQTIRKEKELEAKERFVQLKAEHEREVLERNRKVVEGENRIKQKEHTLNQKTEHLERQSKERHNWWRASNRKRIHKRWVYRRKLLTRQNKKRTKKPEKLSFKVFNGRQPNKPLKMQLQFSTLKVMKLKARSLAGKEEIFVLLKQLPG